MSELLRTCVNLYMLSHTLTFRAQGLPAAREAAGAGASRGAADDRAAYAALLRLLDSVAGREIDAALAEIPGVAEPFVARELSRVLPLGACLLQVGRDRHCRGGMTCPGSCAGCCSSRSSSPSCHSWDRRRDTVKNQTRSTALSFFF